MKSNNASTLYQAIIKSTKFQELKPLIEQLSQEFIIGDHRNQEIFDQLAEKNILKLYFEKSTQSSNDIALIIINEVSFIISNLQNPLNLNYVLCNPVLNQFINHQYDFSDQEMVDYYVNFLKIIAIRINSQNISLYFNQRYSNFPLLWQAQKFINYPNALVRNTVLNIILSISQLSNQQENAFTTQSIVNIQKLSKSKLQIYLSKSPFIIVYQKLIRSIKATLSNITKLQLQDQLENLLLFIKDLIKICPFLQQLLEYMINDLLVLPILNYLLLNQKSDLQPEFSLGFFLIFQIINKLNFTNILDYFSEDFISGEYSNLPNYNYNFQTAEWVYETQNYEIEFQEIYLQDQIEKIQPKNQIKNIYKNQMLLLLTPRQNTILYFELAIWWIIKNNQKPWPTTQIIKLLNPQDIILYSKKVIDLIILFLINVNDNQIEMLYQVYQQIVKNLIDNAKTSLEEDLIINWGLIQSLNWDSFKNSSPIFTYQDLHNLDSQQELNQFKLVYVWLLLKFLITNFKKESRTSKYVINQEISHITDDQYWQIDDNRTYLIIDQKQGFLIQTIACSNPNRGKVSFAYSLATLYCFKDNEYLNFECKKLSICQFKPFKVKIPKTQIDDVFAKIQEAQNRDYSRVVQQLSLLIK